MMSGAVKWESRLRGATCQGSLHTGVEVYNVEWSFGIDVVDQPTGIVCHAPGRNPNHKVRETLSMGFTTQSSGHRTLLPRFHCHIYIYIIL